MQVKIPTESDTTKITESKDTAYIAIEKQNTKRKTTYTMIPALVVHPSLVCRRAGDAASRHPTAIGAQDSRDERATTATLLAELPLAIDLGEARKTASA
jgi:hypothetical protein